MKLINQNDYANTIYITKTMKADYKDGEHTTIATSGCGICCGIMVANFFKKELSMKDAIKLAYKSKANTSSGTKYKEYSVALAEKFDLTVKRSSDFTKLIKCLDEGGCGVINVGGDYDDYLGVLSHMGHYIMVCGHKGKTLQILDPGFTKEKYNEKHRKNIVKVEYPYIYCDISILINDTKNRESPIFMFQKRKMNANCQNIFQKIDEMETEYINIWKDIVKIDSPSDYKQGVDKVGKYFIDKASKQLWDIEVLENVNAGNTICITMNKNAKSKPIVISGHMDTVHPIGSMKTFIRNGKIYGPGCADCKGGLVVCLMAMSALKECGFIKRPIIFLLQSDEEVGSKLSNNASINWMISKSENAIGFINTEMSIKDTAVIERKGICKYDIYFQGISAHSSICNQGASAIEEACYKIIQLQKLKDPKDITVNVGTIHGGTTVNSVPSDCHIQIDVRFNNIESMKKADKYIKKVCNKTYIKGTHTIIKQAGYRVPMEIKKENIHFLNKINKILNNFGMTQLQARKANGGSDASNISNSGIATIDSLGVTGGYIHSDKEYADIASLKENAKKLASVIFNL